MTRDIVSFVLGAIVGSAILYSITKIPTSPLPVNTISVKVENISNTFILRSIPELTNSWLAISKSECPNPIRYFGYGVHSGARARYEKFLFWNTLILSSGQTNFDFNIKVPKGDELMIEAMGYSKHYDIGDPYNVLEYYIVYAGGQ